MRHLYGHGHVIIHVVTGKTEHHPLVAGALFRSFLLYHAADDVGRLFMDGGDHRTGIGIELVLRFGITNPADGVADHMVDIHPALGAHFPGCHYQSRGYQGFAGNPRFGVPSQEFIQ